MSKSSLAVRPMLLLRSDILSSYESIDSRFCVCTFDHIYSRILATVSCQALRSPVYEALSACALVGTCRLRGGALQHEIYVAKD